MVYVPALSDFRYRVGNGKLWIETILGTFEAHGPIAPRNMPIRTNHRAAYPELYNLEGSRLDNTPTRLELAWAAMGPQAKIDLWKLAKFKHSGMTKSKNARIRELRKEIKADARNTER